MLFFIAFSDFSINFVQIWSLLTLFFLFCFHLQLLLNFMTIYSLTSFKVQRQGRQRTSLLLRPWHWKGQRLGNSNAQYVCMIAYKCLSERRCACVC